MKTFLFKHLLSLTVVGLFVFNMAYAQDMSNPNAKASELIKLKKQIKLQEAISNTPEGSPADKLRITQLENTVAELQDALSNTPEGSPADKLKITQLENTVAELQDALSNTPEGSPADKLRITQLENTVAELQDALSNTPEGSPADKLRITQLENTVAELQDALSNTPEGSPADKLKITQLENTVAELQDALSNTPEGSPADKLRITQLENTVAELQDALSNTPEGSPADKLRITQLENTVAELQDALSNTPEGSPADKLKITQLENTVAELQDALSNTPEGSPADKLKITQLENTVADLELYNKNQQTFILELNELLKEPPSESAAAKINEIEKAAQKNNLGKTTIIGNLEKTIAQLNSDIKDLHQWKLFTALAGITGLGLGALLGFRRKLKKLKKLPIPYNQPSIRKPPKKPTEAGVIFPQSPLLAGALAPGPAPLAPLGQMVPSGLQTLTGQYAVLKPAYLATGRIGGPQEGIPTNDDVAFGTGFLITPNHIMTNQHVYEFYKHYLIGPDCGGIEFIAERDRDASDYVAFNGEPPLILPDLDIAIFTLSKKVTDRKPIDRIAVPTEKLDEREVVTISYPCPFEVDEVILSAVEKDPIFAVKRLSQGRVFRHTTDTDTPFGVQVNVDARINSNKSLLAICHNASTLGGSSGAPILDTNGKLVGVHFAGDRAFNGQEAANLAMAIEMLADTNPSSK